MQTTSQIARAVQSTTGKVFQLRPSCPSDWAGEWPTDRSGDILVSEAPGTADGSIFGYWLGGRTLACEGVVAAIQAHMDDHDVIGAEVIFAFPDHVHSSLKADLAELKEQAATASMLALREGIRVRVKSNQARLGGAKYPGREGIIQSENCISGNYWNVRLLATNRAQERVELFDEHALKVLTTLAELATLPPISGREFSRQLDTSSTLVFGGSSYALVPHQVAGMKEGWAVNVAYPDGSQKAFGQNHPLTRSLALQIAAADAMDWWLNRRQAQAKATSH